MTHEKCQKLFEAAQALIEISGLAHYCGSRFVSCDDMDNFENYCQEKFHSTFGRYMAWVLFSVGAENLAKAACVCNKIVDVEDRPDLADYVYEHFERLRNEQIVSRGDHDKLVEGYGCLKDIRNRDAHSYRENERMANFPQVKTTFKPAFNILVEAIRCGGHPL